MQYMNKCAKFCLPNGRTVDLLSYVLDEMAVWKQNEAHSPESCGFLLGYQNRNTGNITISHITSAQKNDYRSRFFCQIMDCNHYRLMRLHELQNNYYIGVWHTHPQPIPEPSHIDIKEWREIMRKDKVGADFAFFIIIGLAEYRVWVGDCKSMQISEIFECKQVDGIYERVLNYEN